MAESSEYKGKPPLAFLRPGFRTVLRGEISARVALLEYLHRCRVALSQRYQRKYADHLVSQPARLLPQFQNLSSAALLEHFRVRQTPAFLPGFMEPHHTTASLQRKLFPAETERMLEAAQLIKSGHSWPLLGFGQMDFGDQIQWNRDPLSGRVWPLDFYADIPMWHSDGSDIRVLWELNRLGHFLTLAKAYVVTGDEELAEEFFAQLESWRMQNPVARGPNWNCAMEVALRSMNLLAAFAIFRKSNSLSEERLRVFLAILDQHGVHIRRNLEFSHVVRGNHYLSDLAGLLWIGIMLPELQAAKAWREWALAELLREMDRQILTDGADYEASTGYHRLVLELYLYSFILCQANDIRIDQRYWSILHSMLSYTRALLRPDGFVPLIGDTDGGQVLPLVHHTGDDHAYLLPLGAVALDEPGFKLQQLPASEEVLWVFGGKGLRQYDALPAAAEKASSQAFPDAGTYVLRSEDLFLLFNVSGTGMEGRGAHGHNDALSIEVSACGQPFLVDPGLFVYTADLHERHLFRSTAYHSTIQVGAFEQSSISESSPFSMGTEAQPRVLDHELGIEHEYVAAEHTGYQRLPHPVTHRRTVTFFKLERYWLVEDELFGAGEQELVARFHFVPGLDVRPQTDGSVVAYDKVSGSQLVVYALDLQEVARTEARFSSRHYGHKSASIAVCWLLKTVLPRKLRWVLLPICNAEDPAERIRVVPR
ncbi:MAG TPA: alginate lyase family protein [Pyrinomonadaceae bacterium]|nr:alginate lyase family protein [Pyrinomonadaceae bacterium]